MRHKASGILYHDGSDEKLFLLISTLSMPDSIMTLTVSSGTTSIFCPLISQSKTPVSCTVHACMHFISIHLSISCFELFNEPVVEGSLLLSVVPSVDETGAKKQRINPTTNLGCDPLTTHQRYDSLGI